MSQAAIIDTDALPVLVHVGHECAQLVLLAREARLLLRRPFSLLLFFRGKTRFSFSVFFFDSAAQREAGVRTRACAEGNS